MVVIMSDTKELQDCTVQPRDGSLQSNSHSALFYALFNRVVMTEAYLCGEDLPKDLMIQLKTRTRISDPMNRL